MSLPSFPFQSNLAFASTDIRLSKRTAAATKWTRKDDVVDRWNGLSVLSKSSYDWVGDLKCLNCFFAELSVPFIFKLKLERQELLSNVLPSSSSSSSKSLTNLLFCGDGVIRWILTVEEHRCSSWWWWCLFDLPQTNAFKLFYDM